MKKMENSTFYKIDGVIETPKWLNETDFNNLFIDFCEDHEFLFSGGINVFSDVEAASIRSILQNDESDQICRNCGYSEKNDNYRDSFYCYYWKYEKGFVPNIVDGDDFCSNWENKKK